MVRTKTTKKRNNKTKSASTGQSLSNLTKREALSVFIDQLVQKKLQSKKKQKRLDKCEYKKVHEKLVTIGINWLTLNALKFRVLRGFQTVLKTMSCPPPHGAGSSMTSTFSTQVET